jgi:hypothetical protein
MNVAPAAPRCRAAAPLKYPSVARTFGLSGVWMAALALVCQAGELSRRQPGLPHPYLIKGSKGLDRLS